MIFPKLSRLSNVRTADATTTPKRKRAQSAIVHCDARSQRVEIISQNNTIIMSYLRDIDKEVHDMLVDMGVKEEKSRKPFVSWFKDKILESYRNGLKKGKGGSGTTAKEST